MKLYVPIALSAIALANSAHSECLYDDPQDVKTRIQSKIKEAVSKDCPKLPEGELVFRFDGSWLSEPNELVAEQRLSLRDESCAHKIRKTLKNDAKSGKGPHCSLFLSKRADWFDLGTGSYSVIFHMKK